MKKISKKSLAKLRKKDFLLTVLALGFLFIGIPGYVSLLNNWNVNIANPGDYLKMGETDFSNATIYDPDNDIEGRHSIFTLHSGSGWELKEQTLISWSENGTSNHTLVIEGENDHYGPWWVTPWYIEDLLKNNTISFRLEIKLPSVPVGVVQFKAYYMDEENGKLQLINPTSEKTISSKTFLTNNLTFYVNTSTIDLMVDKAENGNDRLVFYLDVNFFDTLEAGDIIEFDFYYYQPNEAEVDENKALKWGSGVAGVIMGLIALGSTSIWNPLDKKRPGWLDIQIKKLLNRRKK